MRWQLQLRHAPTSLGVHTLQPTLPCFTPTTHTPLLHTVALQRGGHGSVGSGGGGHDALVVNRTAIPVCVLVCVCVCVSVCVCCVRVRVRVCVMHVGRGTRRVSPQRKSLHLPVGVGCGHGQSRRHTGEEIKAVGQSQPKRNTPVSRCGCGHRQSTQHARGGAQLTSQSSFIKGIR